MENGNNQSLKNVLKDMVETYRLKSRLTQTRLQNVWETIMGKTISGYTKEIKLRKNTLYLTIDSATLKQELSYGKEKIKNVLNKELGEKLIEEVVIR